jgi:hypothetical protein
MGLGTADDRTRAAMLAAGTLSATVLAACAEQTGPAPPGRSARLPDEGFFLSDNPDEGYKLAYGRDGTDDVRLMLECHPGSRKIEIIDLGHAEARRGQTLTLTSGRMQSTLSPMIEADADGGGVVVTAYASPDLSALDGFRQSGAITVKLGSRAYALSATAAEKAEIARFFSGCERK